MKISEEPFNKMQFLYYIEFSKVNPLRNEGFSFSDDERDALLFRGKFIVLQADANCISHGAIVHPNVDYYYCFFQRSL